MKALLARLLGANRPKVIAVFGSTRQDVELGVRHALTSETGLPVWAWCAEELGEDAAPQGCEILISGKAATGFARELRKVWPALSIVAWTGKPGPVSLKLLPVTYPPFRVVVFNEAGGFFAPGPVLVAGHIKRRVRDAIAAKSQLLSEWSSGAVRWLGSRIWDGVQYAFWAIVNCGLRIVDAAQWAFWRLVHAGLWASRRIRSTILQLWSLMHWVIQALFALLAFVARPTAALSRGAIRLARRQKGSTTLRLEKYAGNSWTEVAMPVRGWPRTAVLAAAMQSDAEFLVFRRQGEHGNPTQLIALARETQAFAVAKQSAYSAWRKIAVNKHPFRRLQPGEVSEVFAPFSSLLVIRRATLLRIGVPRALTCGGALMIIFWKASAAGLRSLVLGNEGVVTDEPAMALEDAELALRVITSSQLAGLRPARPARYRGNVAWSPSHSRDFRGKPCVLVVSPYLPFPLSHGGAVRIYNLCRSLAGRVDFILACFHEAGEKICYDELHEVFREVYVVDVDEKQPPNAEDSEVPKQVVEYRNAAMSDLIRNLCVVERRVDMVQLEYTQMAEYRDSTGAVPIILVEHDITFTLYSQLADFNGHAETRREFQRWREFERAALQCSNIVWTMSEDERSVALEHGATRARTRVIPNGVDIRRFKPEPETGGPPVVLFVGSFRHLPNLLAFEALRMFIMPEVWREYPDAVLHVIAGPQHEKAAELAGKTALLAAHPNVVIEGFVADVRPAYRAANVVAVSLPLSAGTNIKLLEAMACGRAIVSTASGCRGLDLTCGVELIVAELDATFAAGIVTLLRDENLRHRIASEARLTAERRFGWHAIAEQALESYLELGAHSPDRKGVGYLSSAQHAERSL